MKRYLIKGVTISLLGQVKVEAKSRKEALEKLRRGEIDFDEVTLFPPVSYRPSHGGGQWVEEA